LAVSGGRASRQKGNRLERKIVALMRDAGFAAERVPLSGAARGRFGGDVSMPLLGVDRRVEIKARRNDFQRIYEWLDGADLLIVKSDHKKPAVILPLALALEIATAAEQGRSKYSIAEIQASFSRATQKLRSTQDQATQ
jgi:Holliday junction resolvase